MYIFIKNNLRKRERKLEKKTMGIIHEIIRRLRSRERERGGI